MQKIFLSLFFVTHFLYVQVQASVKKYHVSTKYDLSDEQVQKIIQDSKVESVSKLRELETQAIKERTRVLQQTAHLQRQSEQSQQNIQKNIINAHEMQTAIACYKAEFADIGDDYRDLNIVVPYDFQATRQFYSQGIKSFEREYKYNIDAMFATQKKLDDLILKVDEGQISANKHYQLFQLYVQILNNKNNYDALKKLAQVREEAEKNNDAATVIQKYERRFYAKKCLQSLQEEISREKVERKEKADNEAFIILRDLGLQAKKIVEQQNNNAATVIQKYGRGFCAKKYLQSLQEEKQEKISREKVERKEKADNEAFIILRDLDLQAKKIVEQQNNDAATIIQKYGRGFCAKKYLHSLQEEKQEKISREKVERKEKAENEAFIILRDLGLQAKKIVEQQNAAFIFLKEQVKLAKKKQKQINTALAAQIQANNKKDEQVVLRNKNNELSVAQLSLSSQIDDIEPNILVIKDPVIAKIFRRKKCISYHNFLNRYSTIRSDLKSAMDSLFIAYATIIEQDGLQMIGLESFVPSTLSFVPSIGKMNQNLGDHRLAYHVKYNEQFCQKIVTKFERLKQEIFEDTKRLIGSIEMRNHCRDCLPMIEIEIQRFDRGWQDAMKKFNKVGNTVEQKEEYKTEAKSQLRYKMAQVKRHETLMQEFNQHNKILQPLDVKNQLYDFMNLFQGVGGIFNTQDIDKNINLSESDFIKEKVMELASIVRDDIKDLKIINGSEFIRLKPDGRFIYEIEKIIQGIGFVPVDACNIANAICSDAYERSRFYNLGLLDFDSFKYYAWQNSQAKDYGDAPKHGIIQLHCLLLLLIAKIYQC